jgi:hypothetical protein
MIGNMDGAKTLLTFVALGLGSCSSYSVSPSPESDAGRAPDGSPPALAKVLYVAPAPAGSPTNDGSIARPIDTLGAAIAFASSNKLVGYEIHACRGTYTERDLVLTYPISIRGGYNCSSWQRVDGFGFAGGFRDDNVSRIEYAAGSMSNTTLELQGIDAPIVVDGFTLRSNEGDTSANRRALRLVSCKDVQVSDNVILGATTASTSTDVSSAAVSIVEGAPIVLHNRINGGSGKTTGSIGSLAIRTNGTAALIQENDIDAGKGEGKEYAAIGIDIYPNASYAGAPVTIRNNTITQSGGKTQGPGTGVAAILVFARGTAIVENNRLNIKRTDAVGSFLFGMYLVAQDNRVTGNRIDVGDFTGTAPGAAQGIRVHPAGGGFIANNLIILPKTNAPSAVYKIALLQEGIKMRFLNNTIVGGPDRGVYAGHLISKSITDVRGNLFASTTGLAWIANECGADNAVLNLFASNVAFAPRFFAHRKMSTDGTCLVDTERMLAQVNTLPNASNNRHVVTSTTAQLSTLFTAWPEDLSSGLLTSAFAPQAAACESLMMPRTSEVSTDIEGKPRPAITVAGAFQGACL